MKIIHFADLHLGVESYGHLNPETGLSTRFEDFLSALDRLVDYALENEVDLVLFCGDAYKSREPSQTHQREFARRLNRLASGGIPTFLLVGNHDLPNALGRATTTEIFDTLAVKNVYVSSHPALYLIETRSGTVQVASLPWLRRSALFTKEETKNMTFEQIKQLMEQKLTNIVALHAARLDPGLPSILAAHVLVGDAKVGRGSERLMAIGQEPALLLSNVARPAFDYIALGHIHKHQVLLEKPPVVYAGSLERVDFGEEDDEKGFYLVEIKQDNQTGKRETSFDFHTVAGRPFRTITVNIEAEDIDPTSTVLKAIPYGGVRDAIVKLQLSLPPEQEGLLRDNEIRDALKEAHYFAIAKEIRREARIRLGNTTAEEIAPLEALKRYLETNYPPERAEVLLQYGEKLINAETLNPNL
ncbi:MAG: exonuclease subunit SbcD [Dehalococcoidales bacterium]|nr:exonuclease subunit SbcD [Dehalococcoidales bacterium]